MSYGAKKQWEDMEDTVEGDFADMIDLLLSLLATKDGDFVTVAGDTPARTRWRVARMASRWKGEIERLQSESQMVIDNCLRRSRKKFGAAREVELQMAAKHVQYIGQLETAYREIRRLINTVWPLHGMTLVKRLRGEGRVKTAAAIGKRGGAVVNKMLAKYMEGTELPALASLSEPKRLTGQSITSTPTPETRKRRKRKKEPEKDFEPFEDEEWDKDTEELSEEDIKDALEFPIEGKEEKAQGSA